MYCNGIIESLRLKKTCRIIKSSHKQSCHCHSFFSKITPVSEKRSSGDMLLGQNDTSKWWNVEGTRRTVDHLSFGICREAVPVGLSCAVGLWWAGLFGGQQQPNGSLAMFQWGSKDKQRGKATEHCKPDPSLLASCCGNWTLTSYLTRQQDSVLLEVLPI